MIGSLCVSWCARCATSHTRRCPSLKVACSVLLSSNDHSFTSTPLLCNLFCVVECTRDLCNTVFGFVGVVGGVIVVAVVVVFVIVVGGVFEAVTEFGFVVVVVVVVFVLVSLFVFEFVLASEFLVVALDVLESGMYG